MKFDLRTEQKYNGDEDLTILYLIANNNIAYVACETKMLETKESAILTMTASIKSLIETCYKE